MKKIKKLAAASLSAVLAFGLITAMPAAGASAAEITDCSAVAAASGGIALLPDGDLTIPTDSSTVVWVYSSDGTGDYLGNDYSGSVTWTSSNTAVAQVKGGTDEEDGYAYGAVTAKTAGTAVITATAENGSTASCTVTVVEKDGIELSCEDVVYLFENDEFSAGVISTAECDGETVCYNYSGDVTCKSSDESVLTVEPYKNTDGSYWVDITPVSYGAADVTIAADDCTLSFTVVVTKVCFDLTEMDMPENCVCNLYQYVEDDVDCGSLTYTSSDESVATVKTYTDEYETYLIVTSHSAGTANITVTTEDGYSASCTVNVSKGSGIALDQSVLTIGPESSESLNVVSAGDGIEYGYRGKVTWKSSDENVVKVNGAANEVDGSAYADLTPVSYGTAVVTATAEDGSTASCTVTVSEFDIGSELTMGVNTLNYLVPVTTDDVFSYYTGNITWSSSNTDVAVVEPHVLDGQYPYAAVIAAAPGTAVITAKSDDGSTSSCTVTVEKETSLSLSTSEMNLSLGSDDTIFVTDDYNNYYCDEVTWSSSDESVVKVESVDFEDDNSAIAALTPVAVGNAVVTAATADGLTFECNVTVSEDDDIYGDIKFGDADDDGSVTISDVTAIQKHIAQISELDMIYQLLADVNADGDVDITDATTVQKYIAHIIDEFPIESYLSDYDDSDDVYEELFR